MRFFCELCDRMRFEVDCAKSHHRVISEGLSRCSYIKIISWPVTYVPNVYSGITLLALLAYDDSIISKQLISQVCNV